MRNKLRDFVQPRREKVLPSQVPHLPYVGMEHVEAHTMRLVSTASALTMKSSANRFYAGDVLYGRLRPYLNKVLRADFDGICSPEFIVLPKTPGLHPDFIRYRLNAHDFVTFTSHLNAGDRPRVDFDSISEFAVVVPDESGQKRIVAYLDEQLSRLDASVAALHRVQANLKRYRASVLKSACEGRLVPTEAELARAEGRAFETGAQLLQRTLAQRRLLSASIGKYKEPSESDASGSDQLPTGWVSSNVDQLAVVGTGATPKRDNPSFYVEGTIAWVTSGAVNEDFVDQPTEFVTERALAETNLTLYPPGTLLVAMYGEGKTRGRCAELRIPATTNQALAAIQLAEPLRQYVRLVLEASYESMRKAASGGVQPNLNLSLVRAIPIPLPPLAEQHRIVAEADRRLSLIRATEVQVSANLARAKRLRQSILQAAFAMPAQAGQ